MEQKLRKMQEKLLIGGVNIQDRTTAQEKVSQRDNKLNTAIHIKFARKKLLDRLYYQFEYIELFFWILTENFRN